MAKLKYHFQLKDAVSGAAIITTGGVCHVAIAGSPDKATLYDKDGAALANPIAATRGHFEFFVADTVASVDLYIQAPGGQFAVVAGMVQSGPNEVLIDTSNKNQVYKIPFSIADSVAATEKDTGFDLPALCQVLGRLSGCGIHVTAADATEDIDVGLGEVVPTESGGDANGFIAASDLDNAKQVIGTNGALFSTNAPHLSDAVTAKSITYTLTSGTDTAKGFIVLPVILT
jgi:hypothetical protein